MKECRVHTVNGTEFLLMRSEMEGLGIIFTTSSAHTPQFNGLTERMNRTLIDKARSMLNYKGLKEGLWAESIKHTVDVHHRTATL